MLKRIVSAVLVCTLLLAITISSAIALDESREYLFSLAMTLNAEDVPTDAITIENGDEITVFLTLTRISPEDGDYPIYAVQDQILYDKAFFEYVDGSASYGENAQIWAEMAVNDYGESYGRIMADFVSPEIDGNLFPTPLAVASFKLRAIAEGSTVITHREAKLSNKTASDGYIVKTSDASVKIGNKEPEKFSVTLASVTGGTISSTPQGFASSGEYVLINASAYAGYSFNSWSVKDAQGNDVTVTNYQNANTGFTMPSDAVSVFASFTRTEVVVPPGPGGDSGGIISNTDSNTIELNDEETPFSEFDEPRFIDVPFDHWAYTYIEYLAQNGFVNGKTADTFAPSDTITRAEFVTILARMSGDKLPELSQSKFGDVEPSQYYAASVEWAVEAGVTNGTSESTFSPQNNIRRQDIATMIVRYAAFKGFDFAGVNPPQDFKDSDEIDEYAEYAVSLMQQANIINGYEDGAFRPKGYATRAEVAKLLALVYNSTHPEEASD